MCIRDSAWGVLSLTAPGGHPYGVPLNYALWEPDPAPELPSTADAPFPPGFSLVFHSAMYGLKLDILSAAILNLKNPSASMWRMKL